MYNRIILLVVVTILSVSGCAGSDVITIGGKSWLECSLKGVDLRAIPWDVLKPVHPVCFEHGEIIDFYKRTSRQGREILKRPESLVLEVKIRAEQQKVETINMPYVFGSVESFNWSPWYLEHNPGLRVCLQSRSVLIPPGKHWVHIGLRASRDALAVPGMRELVESHRYFLRVDAVAQGEPRELQVQVSIDHTPHQNNRSERMRFGPFIGTRETINAPVFMNLSRRLGHDLVFEPSVECEAVRSCS